MLTSEWEREKEKERERERESKKRVNQFELASVRLTPAEQSRAEYTNTRPEGIHLANDPGGGGGGSAR